MKQTLQRGQALILIALAFVGLAAFIGLAVDGGILYTNIGHLRKSVDSASLAAANQFKEGLLVWQMEASAKEFLDLNNLESATAEVYICEETLNPAGPPYSARHDDELCLCEDDSLTFGDPNCDERDELDHRKLVRVRGILPVQFAFLPIIGFDSVDIRADAISETAALDLMLVLDTSGSMAFDLCDDDIDNDGDGTVDDCKINDPPYDANHNTQVDPISENDVDRCNDPDGNPATLDGDCQPFEDVRDAANFLVNRMYFPYDRMGIVKFSHFQSLELDLPSGDDQSVVTNQINGLWVDNEPDPLTWCPDWFNPSIKDPTGCTSTNTAAGIREANRELHDNGREEAVWIMILLSDGAANAARDDGSPAQWICPGTTDNPNWVQPFCRDPEPATRHDSTSSWYDPDDRARDMADLAGCLPGPQSDPDWTTYCPQDDGNSDGIPDGGNGVVIFTVGLGDLVTNNPKCDTGEYSAAQCDDAEELGEELLRYVANAGDDGIPDPAEDPCNGVASELDCGNYYFSPTGSGVLRVFEAIAGRIFTRITH